ncbi:hypothetical protein [Rhizobium lusitanum]|nr:hypothetical protein [Rhizobium lusitanum]
MVLDISNGLFWRFSFRLGYGFVQEAPEPAVLIPFADLQRSWRAA